jgi:membrane-bound lytic murein transglycosylase D
VPDSSQRRLNCCLLFLAVMALSCASKNSAPEATPPPDVISGLQEEAIRQARAELLRGKELAQIGRWGEARSTFARAVDLLLGIPGGVASNEDAKLLYDDVLATTHEVEGSYLAQTSDVAELSETVVVDELTEDVAEMVEGESSMPDPDVDIAEATYDLPIVLNSRVLSIIEMFQDRRHDWFQDALDRSGRYAPFFREVFREEGLPEDLIYLAMVESAFKPRAVSRAGARGLWQFIRGTGRLYGLEQDFWVDDRFDPEKSTLAAARHLKDLYEDFDDWYLVMAAYNSGSGRVERAMRRAGSRDFWTLAKKRYLPRETRSYVPLILAAIVIAKNPEAYGFTPSTAVPLEHDVVRLDYPVDLETAAKAAGASVDDLKLLNPELRRWVTPMDRSDYPLRVPKGSSSAFSEAIAAIPEDERVQFGTHVVRRGDSLSQIARRYGASLQALFAANRLTTRSVIHPGQVLTVPVPPGSGGRMVREAYAMDGEDIYVVQRGDTLGQIAGSFGMSLGMLREMNDISARATRIYPGQRLLVRESPKSRRAPRNNPVPSSGDVYVVQSGDNLGQIAAAHRIGLSTLRRLNGMSLRQSRIYPGQKLVVREAEAEAVADAGSHTSTSGPVSYRIQPGDTLSKIATRFGVGVDEIRRWNRMSSDRIVAGEVLTIHAED